jgi:DNA-binding CsgD family transcriptional regulator/membrane protein implicated in regulation of membrane protease activity
MLWIVWLIICLAAFAAELFSLALYLASFGTAALGAAAVSLVAPLSLQLAAFCLLFVLLLFAVRPAVLRFVPFNAEGASSPRIGPAGQRGTVVERVDSHGGQIRIGRSEFWTARSVSPDVAIEPNREVEIERVDGLVAIVRPVEPAVIERALPAGSIPFGLSAREVEVLRLVAAGLSNQEIADRLFLSPRTVHHHVSHILTKMNVDSRLDAARVGFQRGLVPPEE